VDFFINFFGDNLMANMVFILFVMMIFWS